MTPAIIPSIAQRSQIEASSRAGIFPCWTCSTCDQECPVNRSAGNLRPQKIVRMATLGMMDELLTLPDIWYCLTCRRCTTVCPNQVKPESLIEHLRRTALRRGLVSAQTYRSYQTLVLQFQRTRRQLAEDLLSGKTEHPIPKGLLSNTPTDAGKTFTIRRSPVNSDWRVDIGPFQVSACFTCSECSNACPVSGDRGAFDPQWIFRMANLGLVQPLLTSAAIWLCIGCGRCTDACGQLVQGRQIIEFLQQKAIADGYVAADFPFRWSQAQSWIFSEYVRQIDSLMRPTH